MHKHIRKYFKNEKIIKLLEFPILFLGATPKNTPSLYSLMNFADIKLGTWYPEGGMHKIVEAMVSLAKEKGVKFYLNEEVKSLGYNKNSISYVITEKKTFNADRKPTKIGILGIWRSFRNKKPKIPLACLAGGVET